MEHEEWHAVDGFDGLYEVSSLGRVKSLGRVVPAKNGSVRRTPVCILRCWTTPTWGYIACRLYAADGKGSTHNVHRLVARAFLGHPPDTMVVNHLDGVKSNNGYRNLKYVTQSDNHRHAFATGLKKRG